MRCVATPTSSCMIDSIKRPIAGCLACGAGLVTLTLLAYEAGPFERLDSTALNWFATNKESSLGTLATFFTHLGDPLSLLAALAIVCLIALRWGGPRHAIAAVALVAGANLTSQVLKMVLVHQRYQPTFGHRQIVPTAFPSGHSTAAMSMALALTLVVPRSWRPAVILLGACIVPAIGCSLVILNDHYPSDVVGGWLVAAGWCFAVVVGLRVVERRRPHRRAQLAS